MRLLLLRLLLVLLPFILYALYAAIIRKENPFKVESWREAPLAWLTGASIATMAAMLIVFALTIDGERSDDYRPARFEDGRLVPGRIDKEGAPTGPGAPPAAGKTPGAVKPDPSDKDTPGTPDGASTSGGQEDTRL